MSANETPKTIESLEQEVEKLTSLVKILEEDKTRYHNDYLYFEKAYRSEIEKNVVLSNHLSDLKKVVDVIGRIAK